MAGVLTRRLNRELDKLKPGDDVDLRVYAGGQLSYMALSGDFSKSVVGLTNFIFRDSVLQQPTSEFGLLPKTTTQGTGFGGFVGRNWQWDDIVFGVEANYSYFNSLNTKTSGFNSLEIVDPPGQNNPPNVRTTYTVTLTGAAAATLKDAIAFRARTGWAAGNFLPYVFGSPLFALILFIVFYGLDWVATVPPTVQLARRVFGAQNFAIVYGWIFAAHQMGAATIAFAAGAVRTFFGDYQLAFMSSGLLCLVAAGLVLRIARERPGTVVVPEPGVGAEAPAYS